jgi:hypothetical protein
MMIDPYFGGPSRLASHGRVYTFFISHLNPHISLLERDIEDPLRMCIELE